MFLTRCSPASSKAKSSLSRTWSRTTRLTQIPPGSAKAFESRRDVNTIAVDVAAVLDDVAEIDPDAELDAPLVRHSDVTLGHLVLNLDGATYRIDNTGELNQEPIASRLNNAAAVLLYLWVSKPASQLFQRGEGAFLIRSRQTRIAATSAAKIAASRRWTLASAIACVPVKSDSILPLGDGQKPYC